MSRRPCGRACSGGPYPSATESDHPDELLDERFAGLELRALPGGLTLIVASSRRARGLGLSKLDALPVGYGLLLAPCRSVHTLTMRFALDLVWLDGDERPVRHDAGVAPRRMRTCLRARSVIETAAGEGARFRAALAAESQRSRAAGGSGTGAP